MSTLSLPTTASTKCSIPPEYQYSVFIAHTSPAFNPLRNPSTVLLPMATSQTPSSASANFVQTVSL